MKVSVITPVLNGIATIGHCINSVKSQDYAEVEHLIIDGGSTDGTVEYLESINANFKSEQDLGIYDAFNKGIQKATGEIIHVLNSDDYYAHSYVISLIISVFKKQNCDLCHGFVVQIDKSNHPIWRIGRDVDKKTLLKKMYVAHPSVFLKKNVFTKYGNFNNNYCIAGDYDFFLRIWDTISIRFLPELLVYMRNDGVSNSQIIKSCFESAHVAIKHGKGRISAYLRCGYEICKHSFVVSVLRKIGFRKV